MTGWWKSKKNQLRFFGRWSPSFHLKMHTAPDIKKMRQKNQKQYAKNECQDTCLDSKSFLECL